MASAENTNMTRQAFMRKWLNAFSHQFTDGVLGSVFTEKSGIPLWNSQDPGVAFKWYANGFMPALQDMTKDRLEEILPILREDMNALVDTPPVLSVLPKKWTVDVKELQTVRFGGERNGVPITASEFYLTNPLFKKLLAVANDDDNIPKAKAALHILSAIYKQVVLEEKASIAAAPETVQPAGGGKQSTTRAPLPPKKKNETVPKDSETALLNEIEKLQSAYTSAWEAQDKQLNTARPLRPGAFDETISEDIDRKVFETKVRLAVVTGKRKAASPYERKLSTFSENLWRVYEPVPEDKRNRYYYWFGELFQKGRLAIVGDKKDDDDERIIALKRAGVRFGAYNDALMKVKKSFVDLDWPEDDDEAAPLVDSTAAREIALAREAFEKAETELARLKSDESDTVEALLKGQAFKAAAALAIAKGRQPSPDELTTFLARFAEELLRLYGDLEKSEKTTFRQDLLYANFYNLWTDGKAAIEADLGVANVSALTPIGEFDADGLAKEYNDSLGSVEFLGAQIRGGASDASSSSEAESSDHESASDSDHESATRPSTTTTTTTTTTGGSTGPGSSTGETGDSDVGDVYLSYKRDMRVWLKDFYAAYGEDRYGDAYNAAETIWDLTVEAYRHYEKASDVPTDIYVPRWFLSDIFRDESNIDWQKIKNTDSRARLRLAFRRAMVDVLAKAFDEFIETSPTPTLKFAEGANGPYPQTEYGKARKKYDDVVKEIRGLPFFESLETGDSFPRFGSGATTEGGTRGADPRPSTTRALTGSRSVTATTFPRVGSGAPTESGTQPVRSFDFFTLIEPSTRELTEPPKPKEAPATQAFDPNNFWYYGPVGTNGFSNADDEKHFRYSRGLEKVQATNPWIPQARGKDLR